MVHRANQPKILLIEDEPVFRMTLSAFLRSKNYLLMESKDGAEGLACVAIFQPDVVLCDLHMPGLTGHQVISIIHQRYPTIPVIVISGVARFDDVTQALREGAYDYLLKPITDWNIVTDAIAQALSKSQTEDHYQELQQHRALLLKDDYTATKLMQMMQQKASPLTLGAWQVDYTSSAPLLYADFYLVNHDLMVVIVELYAEMLDVAFVAAMLKFLLDPPYRQYLHNENHIFDSPRNVLSYLNWHICQSGILCNINCAVLLFSNQTETMHFANAGLSSPHWLQKTANLSLGLLSEVDYHNFNKVVSYPFELGVVGEAESNLLLKITKQ